MSILFESNSDYVLFQFYFMDMIITCKHCGNEFHDLYRACCSAKCTKEISQG